MGVVENEIMNEARSAEDDSAPVAPNFINDVIPSGGGLSMGFLVNARMN